MRKSMMTALVAALLALPSAAFAEVLQGTITALDKNSFNLSRTDSAGELKDMRIKVNFEKVQLEGLNSAAELEVGDYVSVEANKNMLTRSYTAKAITQEDAMATADRLNAPIQADATAEGLGTMTSAERETSATGLSQSSAQTPAPASEQIRQNTPMATSELGGSAAAENVSENEIYGASQPGTESTER